VEALIYDLDLNNLKNATISSYLSTGMTLVVNVMIIPGLIDLVVAFEDFKTKSSRQIAILNRNFIFMIINSIMLPLTSVVTIEDFITEVGKSELIMIPYELSLQLSKSYIYFL
jgi:hypothetical protein